MSTRALFIQLGLNAGIVGVFVLIIQGVIFFETGEFALVWPLWFLVALYPFANAASLARNATPMEYLARSAIICLPFVGVGTVGVWLASDMASVAALAVIGALLGLAYGWFSELFRRRRYEKKGLRAGADVGRPSDEDEA